MHSPARRNPGRGTDHRRRVEATAEEASHRPRRLKASSYGRLEEVAELLRVVLLTSVTDLGQRIHIPVAPHLEAPLFECEHVRWRKTAHPPIKRRGQVIETCLEHLPDRVLVWLTIDAGVRQQLR